MTDPAAKTSALSATCEWCGAALVPDDGVWTDRATGSGDYCPEGLAVGSDGTSPHLPVLATNDSLDAAWAAAEAALPEDNETGLREAATEWHDAMRRGDLRGVSGCACSRGTGALCSLGSVLSEPVR